MPRLLLEPYLLTEELFHRPREQWQPGSCWWVMHTKPRTEKALARRLGELNREFFLPLFQHRTLKKGRVATSHLPLFPSYMFVLGTEEDRLAALKTNYIVQCLHVEDQDQLHQDLSNIYRLMQSGEDLCPESRLEPGDPVEIIHGSLTGMQGRVLRRENRMRFLVEVRLLQRGVSVELESWMITPSS